MDKTLWLTFFWATLYIAISHPHVAYSLDHFHRATMKNKACSLSGPLMLKAKSSEKFLSPKICKILTFYGALEIRGYEKLQFLLQKAHPCMNPRRLSHFA